MPMEKTLGKDLPPSQREAFLKDNCDAVVDTTYMKRFTPEEIQAKKEKLSNVDIALNDIEEEKKDALADFKFRMEPLKEERKELLKNIKEKALLVSEKCFKMVDRESRVVGIYNAAGDLVDERPALADELQGTIFQITRATGTEG
jgi:hypothetical protein